MPAPCTQNPKLLQALASSRRSPQGRLMNVSRARRCYLWNLSSCPKGQVHAVSQEGRWLRTPWLLVAKDPCLGNAFFLELSFLGGCLLAWRLRMAQPIPWALCTALCSVQHHWSVLVPSMGWWMWGGKGRSCRAPIHFHFIYLREELPNEDKCCPEPAAITTQAQMAQLHPEAVGARGHWEQ